MNIYNHSATLICRLHHWKPISGLLVCLVLLLCSVFILSFSQSPDDKDQHFFSIYRLYFWLIFTRYERTALCRTAVSLALYKHTTAVVVPHAAVTAGSSLRAGAAVSARNCT